MNKTLKAALAATLVLSAAQGARADLTINGEVGLPLNPTAQIPSPNGVRIQGTYADFGELSGGGVNVADFKYYGIHAAGRVADRFELNGGVSKLSVGNEVVPGILAGLDNTGIAIGAKYLISRETEPEGVRLAVGAGYNRVLAKNVHAYFVASKYLGDLAEGRMPITGHLGLRYDRFTFSDVGGGKSNKASLYAGIEAPVTRDGALQVAAEVQSKNNEFGGAEIPWSASLRYRPVGKGFSASLGYMRQGLAGIGDGGLFLQLGYTFSTPQAGP